MKAAFYLTEPAKDWEKGLPVGNGRMGDVAGAEFLGKMHLSGASKYINPYQPAAFLEMVFWGMPKKITAYRRALDMEQGLVTVEYEGEDIRYERACFADFDTGAVCLKLRAAGKKKITVQMNLNRRPFEEESKRDGQIASLLGTLGEKEYCVSAMLGETDGEICSAGDYLAVEDAGSIELFLYAATAGERGQAEKLCAAALQKAAGRGYETLLWNRQRKWRELFGRMEFSIKGLEDERAADELLKDAENPGTAAKLSWLLFHYGRYLLISSSVNCALPANLQGIWNGSFTPPWESAYTININLQMNYWMADACGLSECWEPYVKLMGKMLENGRRTAREVYGCRGAVAHHNTNLWGDTDLEGLWQPASIWSMGYAWLCAELYRHDTYHREPGFLSDTVLPFLREAIRFFYDYLIKDEDGYRLTGPSVSPENTYETEDGQRGSLSMMPSMDGEILRDLCGCYLEGAEKTGTEPEETVKAAGEILASLPAIPIGEDGRIQEWREAYRETEPGHRHISHLYSLYPGREWTEEPSEYRDAAEKTLRHRLKYGGGHTGWSRIWILCFWARLGNREEFETHLKAWLKNSLYENLWDAHPPFQIDGNLGYCAAVTEALARRIKDRLILLPALPKCWEEGDVKGLCLPEGLRADFSWKAGKLTSLALTASWPQSLSVCWNEKETAVTLEEGKPIRIL